MEKYFTSMDIERLLLEYEKSLCVRFEEMEDELDPDIEIPPPPQVEKMLESLLKRKVSILKNKDYYAAKLMQLFKLTTLLLDDDYQMEDEVRQACIGYLLDELFDDLTDVIHIIDSLPDLKKRVNPS